MSNSSINSTLPLYSLSTGEVAKALAQNDLVYVCSMHYLSINNITSQITNSKFFLSRSTARGAVITMQLWRECKRACVHGAVWRSGGITPNKRE